MVDPNRPLDGALEIRSTGLFSVICLKSDKAKAVIEEEKPAEKKAEAKPADDDEDWGDDDDLFGDDDEDDGAAEALKAKLEAAKRLAKKEKAQRSLIVLEVKPFEVECDLEAMALGIKKIEHEGIQNWGAEHKLIPVAYGIKKLAISVVVFDEKMLVDDLCEMIEAKYGDDVQSIDVQAMSKV